MAAVEAPPRGGTPAGELVEVRRPLVVRNETARKLVVEGDRVRIFLAPFDEAELAPEDLERLDLHKLRASGKVELVEPPPLEAQEVEVHGPLVVLGLMVFIVPVWAVVGAFAAGPGYWRTGAAVIVGTIVVALIASRISQKKKESPEALKAWIARAQGWFTQQLYLAVSLAIGVLVPAVVIIFAGGMLDVVDAMRAAAPGTDIHPHVVTIVGRGLQLAFIAVVSLLPALLFFLFDREQLATLRDRFMRQIVRFDGTVETRAEILAKYGHAMDEAYGSKGGDTGRLLPGRRSPVLVATVILTFGWILTLTHADSGLIRTDSGLLALLQPPREPVIYGFLGAYVYALGAVLRGYVRKDLRPKSYTHITVRTILVIVLAWVLALQWSGDLLLLLVFVAGLFPETAIVLIMESVRRATALPLVEQEPEPLTRLEGIDLYDRTRLLDEGVTSVQGLAHHDVVELMLQTRIHASQLVDWVDQAILYLHAGPREAKDGTSREETLRVLRAYGIRTATDIDNAVNSAVTRNDGDELMKVLTRKPAGVEAGPPRLQVIFDVIHDEQWMPNLLRWHSDEAVAPDPCQVDADPTRAGARAPEPLTTAP
jgi:hypothetical protein